MTVQPRVSRTEALGVALYFAVWFASLWVTLEGEWSHWLTMVVLPLGGIYLFRWRRGGDLREVLSSVGLRKGNLRQGLLLATTLGLLLSVLQLFVSRNADAMMELIRSGRALPLFPLALGFLLLTAGFTEELFFRGVLQTRLGALFGNRVAAVVVAALLFGLYHLPYAYLHPRWPTQGDWSAALVAVLMEAVPVGLLLGALFEYWDRNLLAVILLHALIDSLPAMTLIRLGP